MLESEEYKNYLEDQTNDTRPAGAGYMYLDNLVHLLPDNYEFKTANILDVGAGPFTTWDWFKDNYGIIIDGVDIGNYITQEKMSWSTDKVSSMNAPYDAHKLLDAFSVDTYDIVVSFHAFEHMFDLPLVVSNCNKVLKSEGYLYFSLPIPSYNWKKGHWYDVPNEASMHNILTNNNFTVIHSEVITDLRYRPEVELVCLARRNNYDTAI